ncbi:MAG: glycoside-pentoside-hexuronide (GPH):cation symporter [Lachnospiraceae bacterium]|nr:glycoside-pentoside-hexuronide (GPH):cation symporter [Lachnospiraceae bacterium]
MNTGLSPRTKWSYCIGATGRDAAYVLVSMFILTYIQYTMKLTIAQFSVITAAMVVCMIWDAVNDLMMSAIIENCHFKSGKFRPFIIAGAILNACVITAMFTIRPTGWGFVGFFCVTYLLWGMTYTVNDIAYWGMLPSLSSDPKERDSVVSLMGIFVCIGQFLVAGVVPIVIAGNAVAAFRTIALIVSLGFIAFQTLTFLGVKENKQQATENKVSFTGMFKILARNDQLIAIGIAYILFCVGQQLLLLLAVNFFYFEFGYSDSGDLITIFTVMYGLGTLAAQFAYPILSKKMSRNIIVTVCIAALTLSYLVFLGFGYIIPKNLVILDIIGFVIFFFQGLFNLAMIVMVNNTIEYDEFRFNERHDSIISAIRSFASKLSNALNQGAASLILIISGIYAVSQNISGLETEVGNGQITSEQALIMADGFIAEVQPSQTLMLRVGMVFGPLLAMVAAYIIIRTRYKIDEKEYDRLVNAIAKRKE